MPEAKHPHGSTFTRNSLLSFLAQQITHPRILGAVAATALVAGVAMQTYTHANLNTEWTGLNNSQPLLREITVASNLRKSATADPAPELQEQLPTWSDQQVRNGDTLSLIFKRAGYNDQDVYDVINQSADGKSLERIFPGQTIAFQTDSDGTLLAVRHVKSALETVSYLRTGNGFESTVEAREPELREAWATGVIKSSLFTAGQEAGLTQRMILDMANIFGGVVDFALDPRRGDTIQLVYEELYIDGEKISDGNIIAASFTNQGDTFNAFRYTDANGDTNYYNEEGVSMRKSFLMAPLDFTRISSNFNMRRLHPIYKTTRPHRGTDYAAPTGTPVYAAGDGKVIKAGYTSSNGNYVFIQHGDQYVTHYLHLQKRMVDTGQRVEQSQVIGTVGSTGAATGPHLHYEFLVNGVHRNPRTIFKELPKALSLPKAELADFRQAIHKANFQLAVLRSNNHLAMNHKAGEESSTF